MTDAAATKGKKEKAPDKPFPQFIEEDVIPAVLAAFQARNVNDITLKLDDKTLVGSFDQGYREFKIFFAEADLQGKKYFTCTLNGLSSSTVESFMTDERKVSIDLFAFYVVQRLYAQQWY